MGLTWLRIKFWTKVAILVAVIAYVITFIVKNNAKTVDLWYWYNRAPQQSLLIYTLVIFLFGFGSATSMWIFRGMFKQFQELRQMKKEHGRQREMAELKAAVASNPGSAGTSATTEQK